MSYVIFLYADGLIQWTTGDDSGGVNGLGGTQAQVGFNAGDDEMRFFNHPDSRTANIINIPSAKFPDVEGVESGVLIYSVDEISTPCLSTRDGKLYYNYCICFKICEGILMIYIDSGFCIIHIIMDHGYTDTYYLLLNNNNYVMQLNLF